MTIIPFFIQIAALICLVFAAFGVFPNAKTGWGWLGMALWLLSLMIGAVGMHEAR